MRILQSVALSFKWHPDRAQRILTLTWSTDAVTVTEAHFLGGGKVAFEVPTTRDVEERIEDPSNAQIQYYNRLMRER